MKTLILLISALQCLTLGLSASSFADPKYLLYQNAMRSDSISQGFEVGTPGQTGEFNQLIDHFNPTHTQRFKQRFFVESGFAGSNPNAPVIYYLCGEGTCEGAASTPFTNTLAQRYHAHLVALEHRYYGYSQPFSSLTTANLQFLSMDQAIEDLAEFQKYARDQLGLKGKWIVVGGSYAGALSAFYRLKHPELVVGSLASSAPVISKADFFEYDHHVAAVAGPQCLKAIQTVVAMVEQKLNDPTSTQSVKTLFQAQEVTNNVDFLYVLADMAAIAIQYGAKDQFCNALQDGIANGDPVSAYATIGTELFKNFGTTALQDSFQGATSTNPADYITVPGGRSWMYQSCTEFGYYQTAYQNPAESSRSQAITLQYHNEACNRLFGIHTQVNTDFTNSKFYTQLFAPSVNHIYFTNGSDDPWSLLGITDANPDHARNPLLQFFLIAGSAHCDDLGGRFSAALSTARQQFDTLMQMWLK
jgi:pimeloyl-ACP methyl ester carboxylesterase